MVLAGVEWISYQQRNLTHFNITPWFSSFSWLKSLPKLPIDSLSLGFSFLNTLSYGNNWKWPKEIIRVSYFGPETGQHALLCACSWKILQLFSMVKYNTSTKSSIMSKEIVLRCHHFCHSSRRLGCILLEPLDFIK